MASVDRHFTWRVALPLATSFLLASLVAVGGLSHAPLAAAEPFEVGHYSGRDRIQVSGTKVIKAEHLADALMADPEVIWMGHPHEVLSQYRETIRRRADIALKHLGFSDAQVKTSLDTDSEKVVVEVVEGPRFRAGDVKVTGASRELAQQITDALLLPQPPPGSLEVAPPKNSKAPSRWIDRDGVPVTMQPTRWQPSSPAPFDIPTRDLLRQQVEQTLARLGREGTRFQLKLTGDTRRGVADLVVAVANEANVPVIADIQVPQLKNNSTDDVLRYLGLARSGSTITGQQCLELERKLYESGRFVKARVTTQSSTKGKGVTLVMDLVEYPQAPPLSQPLSKEESALLACRSWLMRFADEGYDLHCTGAMVPWRETTQPVAAGLTSAAAASPVDDIVISKNGFLVGVEGTVGRKFTTVVTPDAFGCFVTGGGHLLVNHRTQSRVTVDMRLTMNPEALKSDAPEGKLFLWTINGGARSVEANEMAPPMSVTMRAEPVCFLALAHEYKPRFTWSGDELTLASDRGTLRMDGKSGRLIEWQLNSEDSSDSTSTGFRITPQRGELARRMEQLQATSAKNHFDPARPVTSFVTFLGSEASRQMIRDLLPAKMQAESDRVGELLMGNIHKLALDNQLAKLDEYVASFLTREDGDSRDVVTIPAGPDELAKRGTQRDSATALWMLTEYLFDRDTWPNTLGRLGASMLASENKFVPYDMLALAQSNDMGPLGCLLLTQVSPNAAFAVRFAQKGSERLTADYFRRDMQLMVKALDRAGCLDTTVAAARLITPEQAAEIVRPFVNDDRAITEMIRYLRSQPTSQDPATVLPKAFEVLWEKGLRTQVAEAFHQLDPQSATRAGATKPRVTK